MISIIIPCYNREKTVERSIRSVLASTYQDIEVIAVDDGSTDGTYAVLNRIQATDPRLRVIRQSNAGPSAARNRGMEEARGEFIAFCDSDDWVDACMYEKMLAEQKKCDADIVITSMCYAYQNGHNIPQHMFGEGQFASQEEIYDNIIRQYYDGNPTGLASPCNKLYRKQLLAEYGLLFDTTLHRAEDWWLNMHAYEYAQCVAIVNEPLYYYLQDSAGSLMKQMKLEYYWQWKASNAYLVQRNEELYHFDVDMDRFYREQLFTIHSLLLSMSANGENQDTILSDDYYNRIIQYDKLTSMPVKLCHRVHNVSLILEKAVYRWLALYYRRGK